MRWTLFEYRYRDAGNFKSNGAVALEGEVSAQEIEAATAALQDGELFIAEQIGVPPLYGPLYRWSDGATADDHCWHEFVAFSPVAENRMGPDVPRFGSVQAFVERLTAVQAWRCELSPHA